MGVDDANSGRGGGGDNGDSSGGGGGGGKHGTGEGRQGESPAQAKEVRDGERLV